jgi:hypothetical protein
MPEVQEVLNGDFLSARCTYNTTMRTLPTKIGNEKVTTKCPNNQKHKKTF